MYRNIINAIIIQIYNNIWFGEFILYLEQGENLCCVRGIFCLKYVLVDFTKPNLSLICICMSEINKTRV